MKRFTYYLAPLFVLIVSVLAVIPTTPAYAATSKPQHLANACGDGKTQGTAAGKSTTLTSDQIKQIYDACKKGFDAGSASSSKKPSRTVSDPCYTSIYKNGGKTIVDSTTQGGSCEIGYIYGYDHKDDISTAPETTPADPNAADPDALAACDPAIPGADNHDQLVKDCEDGWAGSVANKSKDETCGAKSGIDQSSCETGWDLQQAAGNKKADEQLDCDAQYNNPLSWIICPLVDTLASVIDGLDHVITQTLEINTDSIFKDGSDTADAYHAVWQQFRNIALGLMILAGLVIVISQALGMEILDAYTIRKTLPRLLIAAIGITLSWPLMHFLIDASNWLGFGIRRLIYFPFTQGGLKSTIDLSFGGGIWNILGGTAAVGGAAAASIPLWIALGGIGVTLSYAATGALAVLIAILVLVLREIAVIFLMLLAPLAIICYALPNTQKFYKFWWESFSKALLMFPLIAGFIAVGRVFAAVSFSSGGAVNQLIGFISYFAPYFLIPLTFKFAGGFVRQLGGFVNDRGRGAFDGLRKYRSNQAKQRINAARTGGLYRPEYGEFKNPFTGKTTSVGKLANAMGNALDADEVTPYWMGRAGVPGFRRTPRVVDDVLSSQAVEHSANLAKGLGWQYETAWGVLGKREDKYGQGLKWSDNTEKKLVDAGFYGEKARKGGAYTAADWQAPSGDVGALKLANILQADDGESDATRRAGTSLAASAEKLGTFKGNDETRRADIETAAMMTAGSQGRLEDEDYVRTYNGMKSAGGFYPGFNSKFAAKRQKAVLDMAQNSRAEQRDAKLISIDENGNAYSVFDSDTSRVGSKWKRDETRAYSGEAPDGYRGEAVLVPAPEAIANVETQKGQALISAKGETIERDAETIAYLAGAGVEPGKLTSEQQSWRQQIEMGISNSYDDAGSRKAWMDVARMSGMGAAEIEQATRSRGSMDPEQLRRMQESKGGASDGGEPAGTSH